MRVEELADALQHGDLARLRHPGEAAGQLADDLLLVGAQLGEVDLRGRIADSVRRHLSHLVHHGRGMQQRLGRDAADVEADAAKRGKALHEHRGHAEIGGAERGRVTAGAGAQNEHVTFEVGCTGMARSHRHGRRRSAGCTRCGRCGRRGGMRETGFKRQDQAPLTDLVADLDPDVLDRPCRRRGHFHRGLVGFEGDQRVFRLDLVAALHRHLDDRHILEVADIGDSHLDDFVDARSRTIVSNRCALAGRMATAPDLLPGCCARRCNLCFGDKDQRALGYPVADLDLDVLDHAVDRRGYVHRGLVRLQSDQRILGLDPVAWFDQHLDDRHVPEITDVGDLDVDEAGHRLTPRAGIYTRARRMSASRLPK